MANPAIYGPKGIGRMIELLEKEEGEKFFDQFLVKKSRKLFDEFIQVAALRLRERLKEESDRNGDSSETSKLTSAKISNKALSKLLGIKLDIGQHVLGDRFADREFLNRVIDRFLDEEAITGYEDFQKYVNGIKKDDSPA